MQFFLNLSAQSPKKSSLPSRTSKTPIRRILTKSNCLASKPSKKLPVVKNQTTISISTSSLQRKGKLLEPRSVTSKRPSVVASLKPSESRMFCLIQSCRKRREEGQNKQDIRNERSDQKLSIEPFLCKKSAWFWCLRQSASGDP